MATQETFHLMEYRFHFYRVTKIEAYPGIRMATERKKLVKHRTKKRKPKSYSCETFYFGHFVHKENKLYLQR